MWTTKYLDRRGDQTSAVDENGEEVWYVWSGLRNEAALRDEAKQNASIALRACDAQEAGGPRSYLAADVLRVREIAGLLATQVEAVETAIATNDIAAAAVASCEMKDTAKELVAFAVAARDATAAHVRSVLRAEGRFRDKQ